MYYKILDLNGNVVDLLTQISYIKYQTKHKLLLLCPIEEAEAILSSNGNYGWHIEGLYNFLPDNNLYTIHEISRFEYEQIKKNMKNGGE